MDFGKSPTLTAFSNKHVLITGTTGFVGKVVLEKLLRSVTTVGKIYLLVRGNQAHPTAQQRFLHEIATSSIFDTLKTGNPQHFADLCNDKLRFITGELTEPGFGLSDSEFMQVARQIDLVINCAASVNFREPLDEALLINTLSLHSIIKLAKVKQAAVVHVSTCYVNGFNSGLIAETVGAPKNRRIERTQQGFYEVEPVIDVLQQQITAVKATHPDRKNREQALINLGMQEAKLQGWNDTYTFTKWMGEQILLKHLHGQTLTIVRPSIVESTLQEPVPGWIEGVKVADAIILAYAREKVTFFPGNKHAIIDIIPADLVANSIILSGAEALAGVACPRIYQCSSSHCNPIPIKDVIRHVQDEAMSNFAQYENLFYRKPARPFIMVPNLMFRTGIRIAFGLLKFRNNLFARMGKAVSAAKTGNLEAAMKLAIVFSFYTQPSYTFSNEKLCALAERMGATDKAIFPVDGAIFDWREYLRKIHLAGLNDYSLMPKKMKAKRQQASKQTEPA